MINFHFRCFHSHSTHSTRICTPPTEKPMKIEIMFDPSKAPQPLTSRVAPVARKTAVNVAGGAPMEGVQKYGGIDCVESDLILTFLQPAEREVDSAVVVELEVGRTRGRRRLPKTSMLRWRYDSSGVLCCNHLLTFIY